MAKLDIPNDWPRPWTELSNGTFTLFKWRVVSWKRFQRPAKFGIYGFARSPRYYRIWYGRRVLHFHF
jgi:hypothetical protein